ncbi:MAG: ATP-dependent protease ATPase subunit HslU [bacterium JZ-2024 1]
MGENNESRIDLRSFPTPREIVEELDKYIIGQKEAKRAVAIAIRNHFRRKVLPQSVRDEITPKNILMIGPTGVGKTEIARRLARFIKAPFVKVEVTKFTEVGYVGRDVDSIVRELVQAAIGIVREREIKKVERTARRRAEERVLAALPPGLRGPRGPLLGESSEALSDDPRATRRALLDELRRGTFDDVEIEVEVQEARVKLMDLSTIPGMEEMGIHLQEMLEESVPKRKKRKRLPVRLALEQFMEEELEAALDMDKIATEGKALAEEMGIVFLDELDKIASRGHAGAGPDVSREGVQRDLLPLVEGTSVVTKWGVVRTDHILFIAAGAFHMSKPSDLIPELQGRFPVRVELDSLNVEDFKRILVEPENALTRQYRWLLSTEGIDIEFTGDGIEELAQTAARANERMEDIGARRLHTIMERCLQEISFSGQPGEKYTIDAEFVRNALKDALEDEDLQRYIL